MSTTTPTTTEPEAEREPTAVETTTADRSRRGTTATGGPDRWAASTAETGPAASAAVPLAFDPFCTRRLRNCIDEENASFPDASRDRSSSGVY